MTVWRLLLLLQIAGVLVFGQTARPTEPAVQAKGPEVLIRNLYAQVVVHHPLGVPEGEKMKVFAPYISKGLLQRMDTALACIGDWYRQHPQPDLKPPLAWLELGPFSGDNERFSPQTFRIERTEAEKNGSYRVYVRLTRKYAEGPPSSWRIAAIVIPENGHFVVDNIIYLKDKDLDTEYRLSEALSAGCNGPNWVGYTKDK